MSRNSIQSLALANPVYAAATVTFWTVSGGVKTTTKATLYDSQAGAGTLSNPQTLDDKGKLRQAVYVAEAVIATIGGLTIADHDTGIIDNNLTVIHNRVVRLQWMGGTTWELRAADGSVVSITGSTTQGLQEAINLACTGIGTTGYDLEVIGGNNSTGGAANLACGSTVVWPAMQGKKIRIGAASIGTSGAIGANPVMTFDSMMMVDFSMDGGQITYGGSASYGVVFKPTNGVPIDGLKSIIDSRLHFTTIVTPLRVDFTGSGTQGFVGSTLEIDEHNCAGKSIGFAVDEVPAGANFTGNAFKVQHLHNVTGTALRVGNGAPNASQKFGDNTWDLVISPEFNNIVAVETYATRDTYRGFLDNASATGMSIIDRAQASGNKFDFTRSAAITVTDSSSDHTNHGMFEAPYPLPNYNWAFNADFAIWGAGTAAAPTGWTIGGAGASVVKNTTAAQRKWGSQAVALTSGAGANASLQQDVSTIPGQTTGAHWAGRTITVGAWVYATVGAVVGLTIADGVGSSASPFHTGNSTLQFLTVTRKLDSAGTQINVGMYVGQGPNIGVFSGLVVVEGGDIVSQASFLPSAWRGRKAVMQFHSNGTVAPGTVYLSSANNNATELVSAVPIPFAKAVIRNLEASAAAAPGGGLTYVYTVRRSAGSTTVTCTTTDPALVSADLTREAYVAQGNPVTVMLVVGGGAATTNHSCSVEIEEVPLA